MQFPKKPERSGRVWRTQAFLAALQKADRFSNVIESNLQSQRKVDIQTMFTLFSTGILESWE